MVRALSPLLLLLLVGTAASVWAQDAYPVIARLNATDVVFRQLEDDIAQYYRDVNAGRKPPSLVLYVYRPLKGEDLFDVAAKTNLPYDTIATLNGLASPEDFTPGTRLLIANAPGIFVADRPRTELQYLMTSWRRNAFGAGLSVSVHLDGRQERLFFFAGQRFHAVERAFFLGTLFRFPLPKGVITSPFGTRTDPFTRLPSFHSGIDIAAPYGTDVFAAREGIVEKVGDDREYGSFIVLRHAGGYETLYGHLSTVLVRLNEPVASGMIVGKVGSTGMSTGPHLHFEIRRNGRAENPLPLLPKGGG